MAESERPGDVTAPPVIAPSAHARPVQPPPVPGRAKRSMATTVLIVAAVLVAGFFIIVIGAAILIPGLLRARMTANETSAMTTLRAISVAQVAYASTCGHDAFAASLPVLGRPSKDGDGPFLDQSLAGTGAPQVHGYIVTMAGGAGATAGPADCQGAPTVTAFYATAVPMTFGTTGMRSFAINSDGTVWMTTSAAAPSEPFGAPATIVR